MEREKDEKQVEREDAGDEREWSPLEDNSVYGETDMDPNRDDQRDAHHADSDEHV